MEPETVYKGSCHCRIVTFTIRAPSVVQVERCNCSMCSKTGYLHLIAPLSKFNILSGKDKLTTYTFNTGVAKHTFCSICGVKPFYTPRSNPDGISVNVNCLDDKPERVEIANFDGVNWEKNAHKLAGKSKE